MNNRQDEQFVALELTKIKYPETGKPNYNREDIFDTYEYNLRRLSNTLDDIGTTITLKKQMEKLQKENAEYKEYNRYAVEKLCEQILKALENCRKDMEPYVYKGIKDICEEKIQ